MQNGQAQQITAAQVNAAYRQAIVANAYEYERIIYSKTFNDLPGNAITIPVQNTGLIKKFVVEVAAEIANAGGNTQTLQQLGASNFFSRVVFNDFSNKERINTSGWHLQAIASAKRGRPYGAAFTSDTPLGFANNVGTVMRAPATISADPGANNFFASFEVPVCRSDMDWRGIVDANVTNATARLELTVNPQMFAISTDADAVLALYKSSNTTKGVLDSYTITVYQIGFDQIPVDQNTGRTIVPPLDASVAYMLNNTAETGLVANQEISIGFANNRTFLSLFCIFNNGGTLNEGTDINKFAFQSANFLRWAEFGARRAALKNREIFGADLVDGMFYFDFGNRPINTLQAGNITFNLNPSTVNSGATLLLGWESFANLVTVLNGATIGAQ